MRLHSTDMRWVFCPIAAGRFQVGLGVVPPVASLAGGLAAIDVAGLFPGMPIVVGVAAFHLMRGGGGTPAKSGWEVESLFGQRSLLETVAVVANGADKIVSFLKPL